MVPNTDRAVFEIDHLLTYVSSLETAVSTYTRLGFTLTPMSDITAMGIANQLVTFRPRTPGAANFIELMCITDASRLPAPMRHVLSGAEATRVMVLATVDAAQARSMFNALGYPFSAPVHVKREWKLNAKTSVFPEFDVLLPVPAPLMFNACQYRNVDVYLRPEWQNHANTAEMLDAVFAVSDASEPLADAYSKVFSAPVRAVGSTFSVSPGAVTLELYDQQSLSEMTGSVASASIGFSGFRVLVRDLALCDALLKRNGVPVISRPNGDLVVTAEHCHGNIVVFRDQLRVP